ncbi:MAG: NgoFVII family restriction endonuclease [Selenomonadaceae bacterium]|nr:NgoFVII family restriction endonuclease [Selenomonadaceae bacterium]
MKKKFSGLGDLFKGFNELRAVTFSAGINQVEHFMKLIGSPQQVTADFAELLALQKYAVEYVSENSFLRKMIKEQKFKFYVTYRVHAKIYLMKSNDGRYRVILSSANFSANAWQMRQKENFVVMDEPEAYEDYLNVFEEVRKNSSDEIGVDARPLKEDGTNLEGLPALKEIVSVKKVFKVVHELPPESKEEATYLFAQRTTAENFRKIFKEVGIHSNAEGKTLINAEKIIAMKKVMKTAQEKSLAIQNEKRATAPEFVLNFDTRTASLNDELWNLNPPAEEIRNDIKNLIDYVNGADIFTGDSANLKIYY